MMTTRKVFKNEIVFSSKGRLSSTIFLIRGKFVDSLQRKDFFRTFFLLQRHLSQPRLWNSEDYRTLRPGWPDWANSPKGRFFRKSQKWHKIFGNFFLR
jgi:hypothetical protein